MSKLEFKTHIYTLSELIELRNKSPLYKNGDVTDLETGEVLDINNIDKLKELYFSEVISSKDVEHLMKTKDKRDRINLLENKYKNKKINKSEMFELLSYKSFLNLDNKPRNYLDIHYPEFYTVNIGKSKPKEINMVDYGRFFLMLDFISYKNKIQHIANGRKIKESVLSEHLEFKTVKSFQNYISKLTKVKMLAKSGHGDKRFIHINPAYAQRKMKLDQTLYDLFKDDLKEFLSEYEIAYFEMIDENDEDITPSTIEFID